MNQNILISYRRILIVLVHNILWTLSFALAFLLRFDFKVPASYFPQIFMWLGILLAARTFSAMSFRNFQGLWRYTSSHDLWTLFQATSISSTILILSITFTGFRGFPRSIFIMEWLLAIFLVGGLRFAIRTFRQMATELSSRQLSRQRLLIIGAGDAGEMLIREIQKNSKSPFNPIGFLDDDPLKKNADIHGLKVFGRISDISEIAKKHRIESILIAIPSAKGQLIRRILEKCKENDLPVRTLPALNSLIEGSVQVNEIREVAIEDLLGRAPVELDEHEIAKCIKNEIVLVSGAGGSIGSELCVQIAKFSPKQLLLVERTENNLFNVHRKLKKLFPELVMEPLIADVADKERIEQIFRDYKPKAIFHAAAHKHVPMMEWNPHEAIKNNVQGTRCIADVADASEADLFVMISTDKAVNPTSVMGASKRMAEIYIQTLSEQSQTRFVTVRFGNVLGSAGSVIPIFKEQIRLGGPVTVTHEKMTRYFMTIPEACQLVMQAGAMGEGGEIFVLDMGDPVLIMDLAKDLISLSGLEIGEDIEIQITGMRPGEKLYEELSAEEEQASATKHPKIFVGQKRKYSFQWVTEQLDGIYSDIEKLDMSQLKLRILEVVPEYSGAKATKNRPLKQGIVHAIENHDKATIIPMKRNA